MTTPLNLLSPLDGRYAETVSPLQHYFSEFAYLRERTRVELDYLSALAKIGLIRHINETELAELESIKTGFSIDDAEAIQAYEKKTRHDVKAIEYFLRDKLRDSSTNDLVPWLHFGLTSEDVNNIAQAIALQNSRDTILLPSLKALLQIIRNFAKENRALSMLARTHGQPAVPTTLGKEFAVYLSRLKKVYDRISTHQFEAKLTGAVGNFNALQYSFPQVDWLKFSTNFIHSYRLEPNLITTQVIPYDNWLVYFDSIEMLNSILIDFSQDIWRYISDGYLKLSIIENEVGSSTMPQKVNPIDFENAEGNLGIANALLTHYSQKLSISRLQRDLSDSTVRRTFGVALGHTLLAWENFKKGMKRISPDNEKFETELNIHWEVIAEGAQTILRTAGRENAYESLKEKTRGLMLTESDYKSWAESIDVTQEIREKLTQLSPDSYLGLAIQIVDKILSENNPL